MKYLSSVGIQKFTDENSFYFYYEESSDFVGRFRRSII